MDHQSGVTTILSSSVAADEALAHVIPMLVGELRRIAGALQASYPPTHDLQPTALVNELYCELMGAQEFRDFNRESFLRLCGVVMRRLIVRDLRRNLAVKRGGDSDAVPLEHAANLAARPDVDLPTLLSLDGALERLAETEPRLSALVEMRFFAGFSIEEVADALEVSPATVKRDWTKALERLREEMDAAPPPGRGRTGRTARRGHGQSRWIHVGDHVLPAPPGPGDPPDNGTVDRGSADRVDGVGFLDEPIFSVRKRRPDRLQKRGTLGEYTIDRPIARGGFSDVYLAHRPGDRVPRRYAIKVLRPDLVDSGYLRKLFAREGTSRLLHNNLVRTLDWGVSGCNRPYLVMQFVEGLPITDYCNRHEMGSGRRLQLLMDLCEIVGHLHRRRVVHCDLKPSNTLVTALGHVKLLDFGIARHRWTQLAGREPIESYTLRYASPEQLRGESPTPAVDIYALGVILFELLTGRSPHGSPDGADALRRRIRHGDPPDLVQLVEQNRVTLLGLENGSARAWRSEARLRRQRLRLARALGPTLERVLSRDPLKRKDLDRLHRDLEEARKVGADLLGPAGTP